MQNESKNDIDQAINFAKNEDPNSMKDSIFAAIASKVTDALDLKKVAVASNLFNSSSPEEEEETEE